MRIPFVGGKKDAGDPERSRLSVPEGQIPHPIPGPWTLKAVVRGAAPPTEPEADAPPLPVTPSLPGSTTP
jgi:hypothetical protein